eukprot:5728145-Prymnesium_polylepis.1
MSCAILTYCDGLSRGAEANAQSTGARERRPGRRRARTHTATHDNSNTAVLSLPPTSPASHAPDMKNKRARLTQSHIDCGALGKTLRHRPPI